MRLREGQAAALRELQAARGLFAQLGVGEGKTGVCMLAPSLLRAERPVLVIPGSLRDEVAAEFEKYSAAGWRVRMPKVITYTELGQRYNETLLAELDPDLLMLDEAWHARNLYAACTCKLDRWITDNPQCVVAVLAGTLLTADLLDYHHLMLWALKDRAPVPLQRSEAERWVETVATTRAFQEHLRGTRGVVTSAGSSCGASIEISWWRPNFPEVLRRAIEDVETTGMRPDGELLGDADVVECLCQLAQGFYYIWDPMPPEDWRQARRAWHAYERAIREERLHGLNTTKAIEDALDGDAPVPYADTGRDLLGAWRAIEPSFQINQRAVWIDDAVLQQAAARPGPELIWTRHEAAGERLVEFGVPWYPGGAIPPRDGKRTIALSIRAHAKGRNLQAWQRGLVLTPMANPEGWEQLIGRTHRQGQRADIVEVAILDAIDYHRNVMSRVRYEARKDGRAAGLEQKLIRATWRK